MGRCCLHDSITITDISTRRSRPNRHDTKPPLNDTRDRAARLAPDLSWLVRWLTLQPQAALAAELPRHRSALYNAGDFTPELAVDDRPPRNQGELVALLDHGELAAR